MSREQQVTALRKGTEARQKQRALKAEIKQLPREEGYAVAADVVEANQFPGLRVGALITSVRAVGDGKMRQILAPTGVDGRTMLRHMSDWERVGVAEAIRTQMVNCCDSVGFHREVAA